MTIILLLNLFLIRLFYYLHFATDDYQMYKHLQTLRQSKKKKIYEVWKLWIYKNKEENIISVKCHVRLFITQQWIWYPFSRNDIWWFFSVTYCLEVSSCAALIGVCIILANRTPIENKMRFDMRLKLHSYHFSDYSNMCSIIPLFR